jgi:hypothetical protein
MQERLKKQGESIQNLTTQTEDFKARLEVLIE